ncbi:phosphohydrolase [Deltaproteobacteria bacterium Smac51]|nr:phosphohydrolase [Deltaproteobacteria bacterium Smac51]
MSKTYWSYKANLKFVHRMRDPIYGFIPLTQLEMDIIDTPIFQRLRRVHQLALTKYVYPSAEHSRFVHSIGVMHCASLIYEGIFNHKDTVAYMEPNEKKLQTLRLAALLHDIGHLPFSHAAEEQLLPPGFGHEDLSGYIITEHNQISDSIKKYGCDPKLVAMLLTKMPTYDFKLEHDIISGNLDADRADYLLRDSRMCGVCYGEYDFARFLHMFAAIMDTNRHYKLFVGESDLWQAESLLIARYHYNLQVPYHRTRSGFDIALRQFIKSVDNEVGFIETDGNFIKSMDFDKFINYDDYSIMEKAKTSSNCWADYILRKNHLRVLLDTTSHIDNSAENFAGMVARLNEAGLTAEEDYFIQQQAVPVLKGAVNQLEEPEDTLSSTPPYGSIYLLSKNETNPVDICDRSWIFKQFTEKPLNIYRIYVTIQKREIAQRAMGSNQS